MAKKLTDIEYLSDDCEAYEHEFCEEAGRCNCGCHEDDEELDADEEEEF